MTLETGKLILFSSILQRAIKASKILYYSIIQIFLNAESLLRLLHYNYFHNYERQTPLTAQPLP